MGKLKKPPKNPEPSHIDRLPLPPNLLITRRVVLSVVPDYAGVHVFLQLERMGVVLRRVVVVRVAALPVLVEDADIVGLAPVSSLCWNG